MEKRPISFYVLAAFFCLFVLFLYGPTVTIGILHPVTGTMAISETVIGTARTASQNANGRSGRATPLSPCASLVRSSGLRNKNILPSICGASATGGISVIYFLHCSLERPVCELKQVHSKKVRQVQHFLPFCFCKSRPRAIYRKSGATSRARSCGCSSSSRTRSGASE